MRVNVPTYNFKYKDMRGKHLPHFGGEKIVVIRASQVGNGISLSGDGFTITINSLDAEMLMRFIIQAIDDDAKILHEGRAIW